MIVLDASAILSSILPDEYNPKSAQLIRRCYDEGVIAPSFILLELSNALVSAAKQCRIEERDIREGIEFFTALSVRLIDLEEFTSLELITAAALYQELTTYDASYLELAISFGAKIATLDKDLIRAAKKAGIEVI